MGMAGIVLHPENLKLTERILCFMFVGLDFHRGGRYGDAWDSAPF